MDDKTLLIAIFLLLNQKSVRISLFEAIYKYK